MTLSSSIEAARRKMKYTLGFIDPSREAVMYQPLSEALSTLPAQPMTEEEVYKMLVKEMHERFDGHLGYKSEMRAVIRCLRSANVLYVADEKGEKA